MATIPDCAAHLFLTERRFHELLGSGVIDRQGPGQYDEDIVREQYITHLREVAAGRAPSESGLDLTGERARLAKEQADAQEMKNAALRLELLPRDDVHAGVTGAFSRVRAKLLSLPSKIAPLVFGAGTIAAVKEQITDAIHEALAELAATRIAGVPIADGGAGGDGRGPGLVDDFDAAAEFDSQPVGGRGAEAEPRGKRRARQVGHEPS